MLARADTEDYDFIEYTVVVKLTPDEEGEAPSSMRVVGARRYFEYGPSAGDAATFRARLYHASVHPRSARQHLKLAFFFRRSKSVSHHSSPSSGKIGSPAAVEKAGFGSLSWAARSARSIQSSRRCSTSAVPG